MTAADRLTEIAALITHLLLIPCPWMYEWMGWPDNLENQFAAVCDHQERNGQKRGAEGVGWHWLLDLLWLDERWSSSRCGTLVVLERLSWAPATRECFVWTSWLLVWECWVG